MKRKTQKKILHVISEALSFLAVVTFLLAFEWAFLFCGDYGPDKVYTVMLIAATVFGVVGVAIGALEERRR